MRRSLVRRFALRVSGDASAAALTQSQQLAAQNLDALGDLKHRFILRSHVPLEPREALLKSRDADVLLSGTHGFSFFLHSGC